jgi:hypothetical protein
MDYQGGSTMKQLRITLLVLVIFSLVAVSVGFAQGSGTALVRFGNFTNTEDQVELYWQGLLLDGVLSSNIMTAYMPAEVGEQTVTFAPIEGTTEDILPAADTVTIQEGHTYAIVLTGANSTPMIIDETGMDEEIQRAEGDNRLIIVTQAGADTFRITDFQDDSSDALPLVDMNLNGLVATFNHDLKIEVIDAQTQQPMNSIRVPFLPSTNVILNGDVLLNGEIPPLNFSTHLSVAELLSRVSQMPNPPFTVNHFLETANSGGFYAALEQCENYMWNVFTDEAFDTLTPEQQSYVRGAGAATVMDSSVLQQATTTPWAISPTTTRGGTPLIYNPPIQVTANTTLTAPEDNIVTGNILMTLSTTGNDVQNVIHFTDRVPVGGNAQDFQTPREIRYNARLRF